jgi:hypothetical protein
MRLLIPFLILTALAPAQVVSVGIKAGIPVTDAVPDYGALSGFLTDTGRWTIGATLEVRVISGLSIEADALYRGYRQQSNFVSSEATISEGTNLITIPAISSSALINTKAWDFPLLLKYLIGTRRFRPFVDAGVTFTHSSSDITSSSFCLSSSTVCAGSPFGTFYNGRGHINSTLNSYGPTAGVGVEYRIGKFKLAPEVRYTHLSNPTRSLGTVMLGFTF